MKHKYTLIDTFIQEFKLDKVDEDKDLAFKRTTEICDIFKKYFPEEREKIDDFITKIENNVFINEDEIPF